MIYKVHKAVFGKLLTSISYTNIPSVHQSTELSWYWPTTISGAMYSSVPTKELVRSDWTQERVFSRGYCNGIKWLLPIWTLWHPRLPYAPTDSRIDPFCKVGYPQTSILAKSKSLKTICPDSCNNTSDFSGGRKLWVLSIQPLWKWDILN